MALDSVQPVPCKLREAMRGRGKAANALRRHQKIDRLVPVEMAALHQRRPRSEPQQRRALARHVGFAPRDRLAEQRRGLREVGRQAIDERQQARPDRLDEARAAQRIARRSGHDGIVDDERPLPLCERPRRRPVCQQRLRHRADNLRAPQHADLDCRNGEIFQHRLDLRRDDLGRWEWIARTPRVFWAVSAVTTLAPWTPSAAKVLRSA